MSSTQPRQRALSRKPSIHHDPPATLSGSGPDLALEPPRDCAFSSRLGVLGWTHLDPLLLAALALEAPVLLVGEHGTAKTLLVERVARALDAEFRHYNASLLNYDDLVGIPLPDDAGGLSFVGTAGAVWDAEFAFFDEVNRCRADLQNKLFPIVHERRVAGQDLPRLRHRWAAMNPPSPEGEFGAYLGAEALDAALADRALVSAEDVLPGHPDRLCDAVAEAVVETALTRDPQCLVAVEVALHRRLLLITGTVAAGPDADHWDAQGFLDDTHMASLVDEVLTDAGYAGQWRHEVGVHADLEVRPLPHEERERRGYSDDQTIAVGYADPHGPHAMPVEAITARRARQTLERASRAHPDILGPDGKVLATIDLGGPGHNPRLTHLNVAAQHASGVGYIDLYRLLAPLLEEALVELEPWLDTPALTGETLRINGNGDFILGGPTIDNGLSGKKLVVDHYGPRVPIGGGALCGKDPHKADRVGPLRARQIAVRLAAHLGQVATVTLGWLPGLTEPDRLAAGLADGTRLDSDQLADLIDVPDLSLEGSATGLELATVPWRTAIRRGYMADGWPWDH